MLLVRPPRPQSARDYPPTQAETQTPPALNISDCLAEKMPVVESFEMECCRCKRNVNRRYHGTQKQTANSHERTLSGSRYFHGDGNLTTALRAMDPVCTNTNTQLKSSTSRRANSECMAVCDAVSRPPESPACTAGWRPSVEQRSGSNTSPAASDRRLRPEPGPP